ncbi:hypothetical protein BX600DRAFT_463159 [Xylariales sp. PMI_506]|nr:hypothetical protein BX600DRAFT_463159 [Xylariales sp. PMI_506]
MDFPKWLVPHQSGFQRAKYARLFAAFGISIAVLFVLRSLVKNETVVFPTVAYKAAPIPNIVHYTMMMRDEQSEFNISFINFLSVYSALRVLNSKEIYIHTDFNETMIIQARTTGNKWTQMLLNEFPEIIINHVPVITHANGREITNVEHRSDMVRFDQVYEKGGIYLDFDVYALRDVKVLREAGFNNIVGRQDGGTLNNGCFMSQKKSALAYIMRRDQWSTFDGGWFTHGVQLLTDVAERLVRSPGEVLILEQRALAPFGWGEENIKKMYAPHPNSVPQFPQVNDPTEDPLARWQNKARSYDWELDFSATYLLHAFRWHSGAMPGFDGVSVEYILKRNSNFALATWHIVQLGLKEGVFKETDSDF